MKKYIATVCTTLGETEFKIIIIGRQLYAEIKDSTVKEIIDGEFDHDPTDKELVERVYALYNGYDWTISDCIEYEEDSEE